MVFDGKTYFGICQDVVWPQLTWFHGFFLSGNSNRRMNTILMRFISIMMQIIKASQLIVSTVHKSSTTKNSYAHSAALCQKKAGCKYNSKTPQQILDLSELSSWRYVTAFCLLTLARR